MEHVLAKSQISTAKPTISLRIGGGWFGGSQGAVTILTRVGNVTDVPDIEKQCPSVTNAEWIVYVVL